MLMSKILGWSIDHPDHPLTRPLYFNPEQEKIKGFCVLIEYVILFQVNSWLTWLEEAESEEEEEEDEDD